MTSPQLNIEKEKKHTVKFTANLSEYYKMWFMNLLLIILTLGIYSFWAIVKVKKYLHQHTSINGYAFNFHAKASQYLIGFLIAIAGYFLFIFLLVAATPLGILFFLITLCSLPWLIVKSWRFEARMTSLNEVRFDFQGPVSTAYWVFFFAPIIAFLGLIIFTSTMFSFSFSEYDMFDVNIPLLAFTILSFFIGLLVIMAILKVMKLHFFINNLLFGQAKFNAELSKITVIKIEFIGFLICLPFLAVVFYYYGMLMYEMLEIINLAQYNTYQNYKIDYLLQIMILKYLPLMYISFILAVLVGGVYKMVRLRKHVFAQTRINNLQFDSSIQLIPFFMLMITNGLIVLFSLGLASPVATIRLYRYLAENSHIIGEFIIEDDSNLGDENIINTEPVIDAISAL